MSRFTVLIVLALVASALANPRAEVKRGNHAAQDSLNDAALLHYKKALEQGADTSVVLYDLGNVMYQQQQFDKAQQSYMGALGPDQNPAEQSQTLYNLGNSYFEGQKYDQAIAAYVEALKRDPKDDESRYNLELARRMMQQQKQQQQQKQDQNQPQQKQDSTQQQQQQQNQDQQKQDQKQPQDQKQQDQQQQQQQDQQQAQQQQGKQMSKQEAERLLNALLSNEQDALKDVKKVKVATRRKREKDW
jgi:tetratricopeptide (TPR) repeat protein